MNGEKGKDPFQAAVPGDSFTMFKFNAWSLKMEPIGCPEMSLTNYESTVHNIAEDQKSRLHCGVFLNSRTVQLLLQTNTKRGFGNFVFRSCNFNPYPVNVENMVSS
jgi:hypothetical protein